jgi:hypothetical protein
MPHGNRANIGGRLRVTFLRLDVSAWRVGDRAEDHITLWREGRVGRSGAG